MLKFARHLKLPLIMEVASLYGGARDSWGQKRIPKLCFVSLFERTTIPLGSNNSGDHTVRGTFERTALPSGKRSSGDHTVGDRLRGASQSCVLSHACHLRNAAERIKSCVPLAIIERPDDVPLPRLCKFEHY